MRASTASVLAAAGLAMMDGVKIIAPFSRNYAPAKGKTGALKIRRAATKTRNVARHKRNCRG